MTNMNHDNTQAHFYASSIATWAVTTPERTLKQLLTLMEKEGYPFSLFYLPVPHTANYKIERYQPQVEGAIWLGYFEPAKKKPTYSILQDEERSAEIYDELREEVLRDAAERKERVGY